MAYRSKCQKIEIITLNKETFKYKLACQVSRAWPLLRTNLGYNLIPLPTLLVSWVSPHPSCTLVRIVELSEARTTQCPEPLNVPNHSKSMSRTTHTLNLLNDLKPEFPDYPSRNAKSRKKHEQFVYQYNVKIRVFPENWKSRKIGLFVKKSQIIIENIKNPNLL